MKTKSIFLSLFYLFILFVIGCSGGGSTQDVSFDPGPAPGSNPPPDPSTNPNEAFPGPLPTQRYTLQDAHLAFARLMDPIALDTSDVEKAYQKYFGDVDVLVDQNLFQTDPMGSLRKFFQFVREGDLTANQITETQKNLSALGEYLENFVLVFNKQNYTDMRWCHLPLKLLIEKAEWMRKRLKAVSEIYRIPLRSNFPQDLSFIKAYFMSSVIQSLQSRFGKTADLTNFQNFKFQLINDLKKLIETVSLEVQISTDKSVFVSFLWFDEVLPVHCLLFIETTTCLERGAYGVISIEEIKPLNL